MKNSIEKAMDYVKNKVIKGDYKIAHIDEFKVRIIIDDRFDYTLWIANDLYGFQFESSRPLGKFDSEEDKEKAYSHIKKHIDINNINIKKERIYELEEQLEKLKQI